MSDTTKGRTVRERYFNKETLLPLSLVLLLLGGQRWMDKKFEEQAMQRAEDLKIQTAAFVRVDTAQALIDWRLTGIEARLESGADDRWRKVDMLHWVEKLELSNPALKVPPAETLPRTGG